ncbi:dUTP diphosphatase [Actinophytocola sp.]|uniref:dUTP diphosphatase n=1 Tax=Actinophytocola sp. TaxID=1872138 RepID=UPI002D7E1FB7|nr:dUTP diphosphatase [Actinophytocola sp.]HET9140005.1 dUTP diphosphatase [Actinophytocola sp.]
MPSVEVPLTRFDPDVPLPAYARPGDAGADLVTTSDVVLAPGERAVVGTGIAVAIPDGYAGFVHPRSGLAARVGLSVVNTPGTIDSGYRGEIRICLINLDPREPVELRRGDRVAQLVIQRVEHAVFREVAELAESERSTGGYGSTGGHSLLGGSVRTEER